MKREPCLDKAPTEHTERIVMAYIDPKYTFIQVRMFRKDQEGTVFYTEDIAQAERVEITVNDPRAGSWVKTMTLYRRDFRDVDALDWALGQIIGLCMASFSQGKKKRSEEIMNLLN